jgi:flagellar hook-associated protein 3 FlgL
VKISTGQFFRNSINQMQQQQAKVAQLQAQLGSGSQLVNPSDNPTKSASINRLTSAIERQDVFARNLNAVETRLSTEEVALRSVSDIMRRVNQLTISAASDTLTAVDRRIVAAEITGLRDELFNLSNTQDSFGNYIFAGSQSSEPAFVKDAYDRVQYNGDYSEVEVNVTDNRKMVINTIGTRAFSQVDRDGGSAIFGSSFTSADTGSQQPSGWVVDNAQLVSGAEVAGFSSLVDDEYPTLNTVSDNPAVTSSSFSSQVVADGVEAGEKSLEMTTTAALDTYGVIRGPVVTAGEARSLSVGDKVTLNFKANGGGDQVDVMAYLLNARTGEMQAVVNQTLNADDDGDWQSVEISVEKYGDYKVVFVGGAYDADGDGSVSTSVQLGDVSITRPGEDQRADYFQVLDDLLYDLNTNDGSGIRGRLDEVSQLVDASTVALSMTAGRASTIASQKLILEDAQLRLSVLLSGEKDLDYASAVTELSKEAMALEALQSSFAKISQLTLFDYIR